MYRFWEKGISPREFKKCTPQDIKDILEIETTFTNQQKRKVEIDKLMAKFQQ